MRLAWRIAAVLLTALVVLAACSQRTVYCDAVVTRCGTTCNSWCDPYGCYPRCYQTCWQQCVDLDDGPTDEVGDGGAPCAPCESNDDCRKGSQCVTMRDAGAAASYCAEPCRRGSLCPIGWVCRNVGQTELCLPVRNVCP